MEFLTVDRPIFAPRTCQVCGLPDGPLVDTLVEKPVTGDRVYLCRRCVFDAARVMGCLIPEQRAELEHELDKALSLVSALKDEIAEEQQRRVVPLHEVIALVASQQQPTITGPAQAASRAGSKGEAA